MLGLFYLASALVFLLTAAMSSRCISSLFGFFSNLIFQVTSYLALLTFVVDEGVGCGLSYANFVRGPSFANVLFLPAELSCLTPIVAQSVGFCDVSEGNVQSIQKREKGSLLGHFSAPGPTRKLRVKVTSSPGRARLLLEEASSLPGQATMQPPPLISYI